MIGKTGITLLRAALIPFAVCAAPLFSEDFNAEIECNLAHPGIDSGGGL
ncbi:MAG: hypothetical protein ACYTAS_00150 [Planctomycetota bacterium]